MGRTLNQVISEMPAERQERIQARYLEKKAEVESLRELRQKFSAKVQARIAAALNIKQPSVSKIEKQSDMLISTLRHYVEALGGELDLSVRMPTGARVRIHNLGDLLKGKRARPVKRKHESKRVRRTA